MKIKNINTHFSLHVRDFDQLTQGAFEEGHFSQQLLEPATIEIVHKHLESVTRSLDQVLVPK